MSETSIEKKIDYSYEGLKRENKRLSHQLLITSKYIDLCESYRNFIKTCIYCKCKQNQFNKNKFDLLENQLNLLNKQLKLKPEPKARAKQVIKSGKTVITKTIKCEVDSNSDVSQNPELIDGNENVTQNQSSIDGNENIDQNEGPLKRKRKASKENENNSIEKHLFKCDKPFCRYSTYDEEVLERHQLRKHFGENPYKCRYEGCDREYKQKEEFEIHVNKIHLNITPFECDECGKGFAGKSYLSLHKRTTHAEQRYHCEQCDYKTNRQALLKRHSVKHKPDDKPYVCPHVGCDKKYSRQEVLKRHMYSHSNEKPIGCDWPGCEARFVNNVELKEHMRLHTGDRPFQCDQCDNSYVSRSRLWGHKRAKHEEKRFVCDLCGLKFHEESRRKRHMETHSGIKPYKCPVVGCDKYFREKSYLNHHKLLVHDNVIQFVCDWPDCGKSITSKAQMRVHQRTHTGEKPFVCVWPGCEARFTSNKNLKTHRFSHTKERPFQCEAEDCDKRFITHYEMKRHFNTNHL